ncbi:acetyl-CoA carboxylase carboxyl transferase, beta subunit, partial [Kipferlia bialata]
ELDRSRDRTGCGAAVTPIIRHIPVSHSVSTPTMPVMWVYHDFGFLGGSLGCAEGERLCRALCHASEEGYPVVFDTASGGARMQEGILALQQMAKVSAAVAKYKVDTCLPVVTLFNDPTYGGVSASYAHQADIQVAIRGARVGLSGPDVIKNTMCR